MSETPTQIDQSTRKGQATYSPRPWQSYWRMDENGHADCGVFYEKFKGQAYSICRAPRYQTEEQWIADSNVIKAAPDLLESLRSLFRLIEMGVLVRDISHDDDPKWYLKAIELTSTLAKCKAAIDDADGVPVPKGEKSSNGIATA